MNQSLTKCTNSRTSCAGQFLSCGFVVLLRKSNPQIRNLKTAVVHGVMTKESYAWIRRGYR